VNEGGLQYYNHIPTLVLQDRLGEGGGNE
jgi:hypothetical protein